MTRGYRQWTTLEVRRVAELRAAGLSVRQIGVRLGRGRGSVENVCRRLGEDAPKRDRLEEWYRVLAEPRVTADVAREMGVGKHMVAKMRWRLRRMGLDVPTPLLPARGRAG